MELSKIAARDLNLAKKSFETVESYYKPSWLAYELLYESEYAPDYKKSAKEMGRSSIFVPITKNTLDIMSAINSDAFFSQGNPVEVQKIGDSDGEKQRALNVLADYYWRKAKPYNVLSLAFDSAARYGIGAVLPYWDEAKKMPLTRLVPCTNIGFDEGAITRDENKFVSHRFNQSTKDIYDRIESKFYDAIALEDVRDVIGDVEDTPYRMNEVIEFYSEKRDGTYKCRSYVGGRLLREVDFKRCKVKHGYMIPRLPKIENQNSDTNTGFVAAIGDSAIRVIRPLQNQINMSRNQINDIREAIIDPYTLVGTESGVSAADAAKIKGPIACDNPNLIKREPAPNTFDIEKDVATFKQEISDATAIGNVQRGDTNTSDRRPTSALALLSANSSVRLLKMITTLTDTLFEPWAVDWIEDIYINAPDELIEELLEGENPLGIKGSRGKLDIDVKINYGHTINKEAKVSELTMVLQMIAQREDAEVLPLIMEIMQLILGENADVKKYFPKIFGGSPLGSDLSGGGEEAEPAAQERGESELPGGGVGGPEQGEGADAAQAVTSATFNAI